MIRLARIFIIFMAFIAMPVYAQQNFASISFGAALPQGDYGRTNNLAASGYARTGGAIKFDAGYFPVSYFGIGGSFSFGSNYALRDSLLNDLITYIVENASSVIDILEDASIIYGSGFWNYINLFMGPHFSIRASQKLYFDFRALAGLSVLKSPDQELRISYPGVEIYSQTSKNKLAFGYAAGGGLRYMLNAGIALKLGVDYYQSRARFDYQFELFRNVAEDIPMVTSDFFIRTLELTAGLAYSF